MIRRHRDCPMCALVSTIFREWIDADAAIHRRHVVPLDEFDELAARMDELAVMAAWAGRDHDGAPR